MTTTHTSLVRKLWFREVGNSSTVTQQLEGRTQAHLVSQLVFFPLCCLSHHNRGSQLWAGRAHFDPQGTFGNF